MHNFCTLIGVLHRPSYTSLKLEHGETIVPRYFFDVRDRTGLHRDEFGDEFDSFEEAREQCQGILPDIARHELPDGDLHVISCDVRDDDDHVVYRGEITFKGMEF